MKPKRFVIILLFMAGPALFGQETGNSPYMDPDLSPEQRAKDLVSRMTIEEKVLQMQSTAPAIPRLDVPAYNWWNEALHGVAQGRATVFPQAIGLAATWDTGLMVRVADIISAEHAAALLAAWYGGEEAGAAIAETLAGVNNPAGRLPVTFYKSVDQLPPFIDYSMKGRTYRYFKREPLYPFGFGLSYSSFTYSGLSAKRTPNGAEISATVRNTSDRDGEEVVQLYVGGGSQEEAPIRSLRGFQRILLRAGGSREVKFTLGSDVLPKSEVEVSVGGGQPLAGIPHVRGIL